VPRRPAGSPEDFGVRRRLQLRVISCGWRMLGTPKMILYTLASVVGGGVLGFAYYKGGGAAARAPVPSRRARTSLRLYGALLGYLIGSGARM